MPEKVHAWAPFGSSKTFYRAPKGLCIDWLVSEHATAEAELGAVEQKVAGLSAVASDLAEGHFDGVSILSNCAEMRAAVAAMKEPAEARKQALMQSMKFHEFNFDLAREMEWVRFKWLLLYFVNS